jgi:hypothetical protein
MNDHGGECIAEVGSLTLALKAQKALGRAAISSTVVKNNSYSSGSKGCTYGLRFSRAQKGNVETVFDNEGIKVKQWKIGL